MATVAGGHVAEKRDHLQRCGWVNADPLYIAYHDEEWGVPVFDDQKLFELLILEGAQAGLSWYTILRKREHYRRAFDGFDVERVAAYGTEKVADLLSADSGIVRNRLKVAAAIRNAKAFLQVQDEFGSFADYLWQYVDGKPLVNHWASLAEVPASTALSERISKDLKRRGFNFVGPTIIYSYLQATGLVMDHVTSCFRYEQLRQ
ncbi:DNA-3-methyladenine glycosylase I [Alicyclobacillus fodiniaquatilis]|jgi:DNA-3-methyladenine glycosylase I|uniref:DNA-3-methyladenine glycosylase I n=1 Tax=Alicyclobacillus fodiniaquatilis TaxID=1661150 RepID=A0ABW4JKJ4_9BACL